MYRTKDHASTMRDDGRILLVVVEKKKFLDYFYGIIPYPGILCLHAVVIDLGTDRSCQQIVLLLLHK